MNGKASTKLLGPQAIALIRYGLAVLAGLLAYIGFGVSGFDDIRLTATTLVALSGTLTGFVVAGVSMLVSAADRPFMISLRKTGHYQVLVSDLITSAAMWLAVIAVALGGHFSAGKWQQAILAVATGLMVLSLLQFLKSGYRFSMVLKNLSRM